MCDYCEKDKTIMESETILRCSWGWGGEVAIKESEVVTCNTGIFIDRGYLRMVDLSDCNCIEAGQKVAISFCPFCGGALKAYTNPTGTSGLVEREEGKGMTCIRIEHGFICGPDDFVNLEPFGAKVWLEWHNYLGPTFYRSESRIKPIIVPSKKTWDAFGKWQDSKY